MATDRLPPFRARVRKLRLTKWLAEGEEPFEVLERDGDGPFRVVFRRPGVAPPASYADLPYDGDGDR